MVVNMIWSKMRKVLSAEIWCYRSQNNRWRFHYGNYSCGNLHHVKIGPLTVVIDYRFYREAL